MANAIGLRFYLVTIHKRGSSGRIDFDDPAISIDPVNFTRNFISDHKNLTQHKDVERSWYFEPKKTSDIKNQMGIIGYGTFGFESSIVDNLSKNINYKRKRSDIEVIPLFFEFWFPEKKNFGLASFQSFQGKSCIQLVINTMKDKFELNNSGYVMSFRKLMPTSGKGGIYASLPVKRLKLLKRKASGDIFDRYTDADTLPDVIDLELTMSARRKGMLGLLSDITAALTKDESGTIVYDGISFPEAIAEVKVGRSVRRVHVLGPSSDAGVIDVTDDVVFGSDGHPTAESMAVQSAQIMKDFYKTVSVDFH